MTHRPFLVAALAAASACSSAATGGEAVAVERLVHTPESTASDPFQIGECRFIIRGVPSEGRMELDFDKGYNSNASEYIYRYVRPADGDSSQLAIPLKCENAADAEAIAVNLGAKRMAGTWQPAGGYENDCEPRHLEATGRCITVDNLPFYPEQNVAVVDLSGENWKGTGILIDDIDGEEKQRQRRLRYCLFHSENALCGSTGVRKLSPPHDDVYDEVLTIFTRIEFID